MCSSLASASKVGLVMRRPGPSDSGMWCTQLPDSVVTEYNDQYIHTNAHEVLVACQQL